MKLTIVGAATLTIDQRVVLEREAIPLLCAVGISVVTVCCEWHHFHAGSCMPSAWDDPINEVTA